MVVAAGEAKGLFTVGGLAGRRVGALNGAIGGGDTL